MTDELLMRRLAKEFDFNTWAELRSMVRETDIGYNLHDLRNKYLIASRFGNDLGYLLYKPDEPGMIFGDHMFMDEIIMTRSKREAQRIANHVNFLARNPNHCFVVNVRERLGR